jgi:hypothetical protein
VDKGTSFAQHVIYGTETDMDMASWLFKFTRLQCYQLGRKSKFRGKDLRTYYFGMVLTLSDRIKSVFGKAESKVRTEKECMALVVIKKEAAVAVRNKEFPNLRKGRKIRPLTGTMKAYNSGMSDGEKVSLNKNINSGTINSQIGG